jgi:hypothetical protein
MYLTLKMEATRPPGMNCLSSRLRFDDFLKEFNTERPHEALAMKAPGDVNTSSAEPYSGLPELDYPFHDKDILVTKCGRICMHRKKVNISAVMAGRRLGIKEVEDGIWLVSFMQYIDLEQKTLQTIDNQFGTRLSPMSQGHSVTYVSGMDKKKTGWGASLEFEPQTYALQNRGSAIGRANLSENI